jgi:Ribosomal large subunit proteins 60S L5, and 50S L18
MVLAAAYAHELPHYGLEVGLTNYAAGTSLLLLPFELSKKSCTKLNVEKKCSLISKRCISSVPISCLVFHSSISIKILGRMWGNKKLCIIGEGKNIDICALILF